MVGCSIGMVAVTVYMAEIAPASGVLITNTVTMCYQYYYYYYYYYHHHYH